KAFKASDGWVVIGAGFSNLFAELCKVLGREDLASDPRFLDLSDRVQNREALYAILDAEIIKHEAGGLVSRLDNAKVPCAIVNNMQQVFSLPQVRHRRMVKHLNHPEYGQIASLG